MLEAYKKKREKSREARKKKREDMSVWREYFELVAEVLIYVFFIMTFLLQSYVIPTGSMKNNLLIGDHLLVNKTAYAPSTTFLGRTLLPVQELKRGMIVTFKSPVDLPEVEKEYVKRIIGLPGEKLSVKNHRVYINGQLLSEPWLEGNKVTDEEVDPELSRNYPETDPIPPGHYFVMGDNRANSSDSREWGPLKRELIIGKPWRIYWSFEAEKEDYVPPEKYQNENGQNFFVQTGKYLISIGKKIFGILEGIVNFIPKTRWSRTLKYIK
jgi:signal peptidase I